MSLTHTPYSYPLLMALLMAPDGCLINYVAPGLQCWRNLGKWTNTLNHPGSQTTKKKHTSSQGRGSAPRSIFAKNVGKGDILGASYFQNRHLASFSKFHHFVGDASYHRSSERYSWRAHWVLTVNLLYYNSFLKDIRQEPWVRPWVRGMSKGYE